MKARSAWRFVLVGMAVSFFFGYWKVTADWQAALIITVLAVALVGVLNRIPPEDRNTPY